MISDREIWMAAKAMIARYDSNAQEAAANGRGRMIRVILSPR
jgi:hypothetical protein